MFDEKKLIEAIALTRLFDIKELLLDVNFVNSEKGKRILLEYKEKVKDIAIAVAMSNKFKINGAEVSLIIDKVFSDVLGMELLDAPITGKE